MKPKRADRVSQQIMAELAVILTREINDPRIGMITVTGVKMSDDLRIAKVYLVRTGERELPQETLQALKQAKSFIRRELARRLALRYIPSLSFFSDEVFAHSSRVEEIFATIRKEEEIDVETNN